MLTVVTIWQTTVIVLCMRRCRNCQQEQPETEFKPRGYVCRSCQLARKRAYDRTRRREPENHVYEQFRWEHFNTYYRDKNRRYYAANREAVIARVRQWRASRRLANARYQARRKFHERGVTIADLTDSEWVAIQDRYGNRCAYCGVAGVRLVRDHVIPIAYGGNHTASNVVPACVSCNCSKKQRNVLEWVGRKNAARP